MDYAGALLLLSILALLAERLLPPARAPARASARDSLQDLTYLVLNGHIVGTLLALVTTRLAFLDPIAPGPGLASGMSLPVQLILHLVLFDLLQWGVHFLLHHVPFLWRFHRIHHAIEDMDWMGNFRFHPGEILVYRAFLWLPSCLMGFAPSVLLATAIIGTAWGHLNHARVSLPRGPWERVLNGPRMHLWHHAPPGETGGRSVNFGILFSAWDWMAGTAWLPDLPPLRIGLEGHGRVPSSLAGQLLDPLFVTEVKPARPSRGPLAAH